MQGHNVKANRVFLLKLKLSNITCALLIMCIVATASIILYLYNEMVYLRRAVPPQQLIPLLVIAGALTHFSHVAFKGLVRG